MTTKKVTKNDLLEKHIENNCELVRNQQGVKVVKACISCEHKVIDNVGERKCNKTQLGVGKYDVCDGWRMSKSCAIAGTPNGNVNTHCYDDYLRRRSEMTDKQAYLHGFSKYYPNEADKQKASSNQ